MRIQRIPVRKSNKSPKWMGGVLKSPLHIYMVIYGFFLLFVIVLLEMSQKQVRDADGHHQREVEALFLS